MAAPQNVKGLLYVPTILLLYTSPKENSNRYLYLNAHGSGIHNSQKMETIQCPSADEYIGKCDIYHNDILFSHKKKWNSDICYDMDEP